MPHDDDELVELFRSVLPELEPPPSHGFVADARVVGRRIKARRRIRIGFAVSSVCAVLIGVASGVAVIDAPERATPSAAAPEPPEDTGAFGKLATAVHHNLADYVVGNNADTVVQKPVPLIGAVPPAWRIGLVRDGRPVGWIEIAYWQERAWSGDAEMWCPATAFDNRARGPEAACAIPITQISGDQHVPSTGPEHDWPVEALVVGPPNGPQVVVTAAAVPVETELSATTGSRPPPAPVAVVELREILRRGDAPAALNALLGIPA